MHLHVTISVLSCGAGWLIAPLYLNKSLRGGTCMHLHVAISVLRYGAVRLIVLLYLNELLRGGASFMHLHVTILNY